MRAHSIGLLVANGRWENLVLFSDILAVVLIKRQYAIPTFSLVKLAIAFDSWCDAGVGKLGIETSQTVEINKSSFSLFVRQRRYMYRAGSSIKVMIVDTSNLERSGRGVHLAAGGMTFSGPKASLRPA